MLPVSVIFNTRLQSDTPYDVVEVLKEVVGWCPGLSHPNRIHARILASYQVSRHLNATKLSLNRIKSGRVVNNLNK